MFERFTYRARRALVVAQEEAKALGANFVGTEHLLLGLAHEGAGVAAKALESLGVRPTELREAVGKVTKAGAGQGSETVPFSPRAKKVLELSLREALQLGHNYIGTEHLLLGLVALSECSAARALASLGVSAERTRAVVLELLVGYQPGQQPAQRRPQWPDVAAASKGEPPLCGRCGSRLEVSGRYRDIALKSAQGAEEAEEGEEVALVRIAYCSACGAAIGTATGPVERYAARVRKLAAPSASAHPPQLRAFPEPELAPVKLDEVPAGRRVELAWGHRRVLEGSVGGSDVQLVGQWAHEGSAEGAWAGGALAVTWRMEASGATATPSGELQGRFDERDVELRASVRLSPTWSFEGAEVTGRVGHDELRANVEPALGGLGGHTVAVVGALGATGFELFASLSGSHSRSMVRGTVAGEPARIDGSRPDRSGPGGAEAVRLSGEYSGPPELAAIVACTILYFM
jgi:hypothetical protein